MLVVISDNKRPTIINIGLVPVFLSSIWPTNTNPARGMAIENPISDANDMRFAVVNGGSVSKVL